MHCKTLKWFTVTSKRVVYLKKILLDLMTKAGPPSGDVRYNNDTDPAGEEEIFINYLLKLINSIFFIRIDVGSEKKKKTRR